MLQLWILVGGSGFLSSPHCGFLLFQRGSEVFVSPSHLRSESHDKATTRLELPQVCCWSCHGLCTLCCLVIPLPRLQQQICQCLMVLIPVAPELSSEKQGMQRVTGELVPGADFPACCRISQLAVCNNQCKIPCGLSGIK